MFRARRKSKLFRKKGPLKTRHVFFISFILFIFTSILSLSFVNKTVEPVIMNIAKNEVDRIATKAIHESIDENMEKTNLNEVIMKNDTGDNNPPSYTINPEASIRLQADIRNDIQKKLGIIESNPFTTASSIDDEQLKEVVYYIPLGVITGNALLANYGPKIPVKMAAIGHVESDFNTHLTHAGINTVFLELTVNFKVNMQIVIPSLADDMIVEHKINAGGILIEGDVPSYYSNGSSTVAPAIMKPEEEEKKE
ncbi:sporulation protein YunB [Peribacillus sp. Hz7]|uniref:sporulation protein YunB n=1 Tax=Peribacillus sp. Hz7 TaxID=3344873 RepID=UPI0035CC8D3F